MGFVPRKNNYMTFTVETFSKINVYKSDYALSQLYCSHNAPQCSYNIVDTESAPNAVTAPNAVN